MGEPLAGRASDARPLPGLGCGRCAPGAAVISASVFGADMRVDFLRSERDRCGHSAFGLRGPAARLVSVVLPADGCGQLVITFMFWLANAPRQGPASSDGWFESVTGAAVE
ncbi:hypothetical protein GCM10010430_73330 [Kitasatospora cystarginea]|uniref:Uncharacterized protein n=1 Tax=Kitasatospora cystarginea TaxID=58350 RepID=A0ABN3EXW5_9ACTN